MTHRQVSIGLAVVLGLVVILFTVGYIFRGDLTRWMLQPTESSVTEQEASNERQVTAVANNLVTPWSITFLPNDDMLVTERSGQLLRLGENGQRYQIDGVRETAEGGLLGVALHPDFEQNSYVYLYLTTDDSGSISNRIERYTLVRDELTNRMDIISGIPAATNHNGGAIAFGPDAKLYVTTGDAATPELAQDRQSLAGKILRVHHDGSIPDDNPFDNAVWSYGHRNPQGIAWDEDDQLWSVEHGPSGAESGRDELNRIVRGGNYGWPEITGDETAERMISPVVQSGDDDTWAPAGLAYLNGTLYFAGLRGQALYEAKINENGDDVALSRSLSDEYGRLRAVTAHEDALYISTSNRDGRGSPENEDDRILRITNL